MGWYGDVTFQYDCVMLLFHKMPLDLGNIFHFTPLFHIHPTWIEATSSKLCKLSEKKTIFPLKQYVSILWVATVFWTIVSYLPNINLGSSKQIMQTIWKKNLPPKTIYLYIRDIRKFTLSSPCLWASFHPPPTPLLVVSVK